MKKAMLCSLGILLLILISANAQAYLVYQPPLTTVAGGSASSPNSWPATQVYDDFSLPLSSSITKIEWWGSDPPSGSAFTVSLYAGSRTSDPAGISGSLTIEPYFLFHDDAQNKDIYIKFYSLALTDQFVTTNTTYWLSIFNGATSEWQWQHAAVEGNKAIQVINSGSPFELNVSNAAFQITGSSPVPIPSAAWLLASGLIGLVVIRRRLKNKTSR